MSMEERFVGMDQVRCHPDNPRVGSIERIKKSLIKSGQFRPLIVQRSTGYIVKGNHTYKAMKQLGFTECQIALVDIDDTKALKIVLCDNAASDKSFTDMPAVMDILSTLPSIEGSGYTEPDLYMPDFPLEAMPPVLEPEEEQTPAAPAEKMPQIIVGRAKAAILPAAFTEWRRLMPRRKTEAAERLTELLGVQAVRKEPAPQRILGSMDTVPLKTLVPYPGNPQQGDTGLVMSLLEAHDQYSPAIVNRRTMHILGGHTLCRAAMRLGWTEIGVNWVDVDEEAEKYILLADNAAAAYATYDQEALGSVIAKLGSIQDTGLDLDDVETLLAGQDLRPAGQKGKELRIAVGTVSIKISHDQFREMDLTPGEEIKEVAKLVGLSLSDIML